MRDRSGTGDVYFDDLFINGIPYISLIFWCLDATIGCMNVLLTPIFFYHTCLKQSFHKNLKIVYANLYLAFFLIGMGNTAYSILILTHTSDRLYDNLFAICRFIHLCGPGIWKTTFLTILLERTAATLYYKRYEKRASLMLGCVLYLSGLTGVLIPICYLILRTPFYIVIGINTSLDFICWMPLFLLFWINKKLRRTKLDATIHLSDRYQITENLRFLQIITLPIILGCALDFVAMALTNIEILFSFDTQLYYPAYMLISNTYPLIFYSVYLKRDEKIRRKIFRCLNIKSSIVDPNQCQIIKNVIGEMLVIKETQDIHFTQLEKYWAL